MDAELLKMVPKLRLDCPNTGDPNTGDCKEGEFTGEKQTKRRDARADLELEYGLRLINPDLRRFF